MSVTASDAPAIDLDTEGDWSVASALAEIAELVLPTGDRANLPPEDDGDQPAPTKVEPEKPAKVEKAASAAEDPAEEESSEAGDDDTARYTKKQYERSRAEANRQRDLAEKDRQEVRQQLAELQKQHEQNEFDRGVALLAHQMIEQRAAQVGAVQPAELQAIHGEAWRITSERRAAFQQAQAQAAQQQAVATEVTTVRQTAAEQAKLNLFQQQSIEMTKEAIAAGVPTYDVDTALMDVINTAKFQNRIAAINELTNPTRQKEQALDLYDDAKAVVRAKIADLKVKAETKAKAKGPTAVLRASQTDPDSLAQTAPGQRAAYTYGGLADIQSVFDGDNYRNILDSTPSLRLT
jgi:hypothetical protein